MTIPARVDIMLPVPQRYFRYLKPISLFGSIDCEPNICARQRQSEEDKLHEEPSPASTALLLDHVTACFATSSTRELWFLTTTLFLIHFVEIVASDPYDVVVVCQFTGFGGKTYIRNGWDLEIFNLETLGPFIYSLVLDFEAEKLVLEVRKARLGRELGISNATSLVETLNGFVSTRMCEDLPSIQQAR